MRSIDGFSKDQHEASRPSRVEGFHLLLSQLIAWKPVHFLLLILRYRHVVRGLFRSWAISSHSQAVNSAKGASNVSMDVSFVIPTHKTSQFHLLRALNSIEKCLGSSLNGEVIVVLDRSNLQSDFLAYVERKFERERLSIKYFQSQMPGVSAARNLGKEMAKGKFLVFLDSDDTIKPKSFEPVLNYFETTERLWLVGAWHLSFEKCLQVKLPHPLSYSHLLRLPSGPEDLFMMWESKLLWPIHAVIMKNEDLPDFPEGLEEMEDLVFWIAMIEKFGKPAISGRMLASYSRHPAQKTHGSRSPAAILSAFRAANLRSVSNVQLRRKLTFGGSFHSLTGEALVAPRIGRTRP